MVLMVFLCVGKHALLHIEATVKMLWAYRSTFTEERLCLRLKTSGKV